MTECGPDSFKYLHQFVQEDNLSLILQAQVLCNEYLDCPERLIETSFPERSAFYDHINEEEISDEHYKKVPRLAKVVIYNSFYHVIKPAFKNGSVTFLAGDTDSFVLKIDGIDDVNTILKANAKHFDFSSLPPDHELFSPDKLIPGKLKLELGDQICHTCCALSPKCYSMKTDRGFKQTHKGSKRALKHELYKHCLTSDSCHNQRSNASLTMETGRLLTHYQRNLCPVSINIMD